MIYITGDTHGDFERLYNVAGKLTKDDKLIVTGDFGFVFLRKYYKQNLESLAQYRCQIYFCDGNHEQFDILNDNTQFPITEMYGGKVKRLAENVIWLRRGEIYEIDGYKFLTIGGARSVDQEHRIEGISWWKEEEINHAEIENTFDNLEKHNWTVDYVISHTAPEKLIDRWWGSLIDDRRDQNARFFDEIEPRMNYKKWFFGHFHVDVDRGKFRCLCDDVVCLSRRSLVDGGSERSCLDE
jgi:DNA repair exonuclease SbcCD nuclease subunit